MRNDETPPIAWLLLRDGHSVPISGLSPDELKVARGETVERTGIPLKNTSGLNAIVDSLGFQGDFGDYKATHWPRVKRIMADHDLRTYCNLFEVPSIELLFSLMQYKRRALSDRIFFGADSRPRRVFTGYGHDWSSWSTLQDDFADMDWSAADHRFVPTDEETTRRWLYKQRNELLGHVNFIGDHLLDLDRPGTFEPCIYFTKSMSPDVRNEAIRRMQKVASVLRWFIERRDDGWVTIIPVTDSLLFLKGPQGRYDLLWRNLRQEPPPQPKARLNGLMLHPSDLPSSLVAAQDFKAWNYYRLGAWEEKERHESELHYYAEGGSAPDYPGQDVIWEQYLRSKRSYGPKPRLPHRKDAPRGFREIKLPDGRGLFISDLITVDQFRRFADASGYMERRAGESFAAANDDNPGATPVGATYLDAMAYAAWQERTLEVAVRLLSTDEHRALRSFATDHYRGLAYRDFPWERWPPRYGLEASVVWSEPRFLDPGPDRPEFPSDSGIGHGSRKRWIDQENWPPRAQWRDPLPWAEHSSLRFIDAWDAYEWCANLRIAGRYWEGHWAAESWGEYKNIKIGFRLVIEQGLNGE